MIARLFLAFVFASVAFWADYNFQIEISRSGTLSGPEYYATLSDRMVKFKQVLSGEEENAVKTLNGGGMMAQDNEPNFGEHWGIHWGDRRGGALNEQGDALGRRARRIQDEMRDMEIPPPQN